MEDYIKRVWEYCFGKDVLETVDAFGIPIKFNEYGYKSKYGWTIDHIWPLNPSGQDYGPGSTSVKNLQVLSVKANNKKANFVTGKVKGIVYSVVKVDKDKDKNNIGRMKILVNNKWQWVYN